MLGGACVTTSHRFFNHHLAGLSHCVLLDQGQACYFTVSNIAAGKASQKK